ncbi:MAG TPA: hypothetical protein VFM25_07030 [Verrucomicrobiae bacterium]|nr:hypothetical protein [Verrucomicrobiae bacterium]
MNYQKDLPQPVHLQGIHKGEEAVFERGPEPGRHGRKDYHYRTARDATSVNAADREPIHPAMPNIPPA